MSGHSKWATIKHKKGAQDKARGKLFAKLIRQVEVAAREGGGDVNANATLRTMFQKARDASVPMDTIERAIKRGTGELEGVRYESVSYEGYAPSGVAVIIEVLTDNRNRTGADVRSIFSKNGGSMAEPGAVSWQFERKGVVILPKTADGAVRSVGEDDLMLVALEAGAEDIADQGDAGGVTSSCWSSTRATTRRCAPCSSGRTHPTSTASTRPAPWCGRSVRRTSTATRSSRARTGGSSSRCWPMSTRRSAGCTACSGRSGSTGGRCSSSTPRA